jgi:hypothetical protein
MISAVFFILGMIVLLGWPSSVYLFSQVRHRPLTSSQMIWIWSDFAVAAAISIATWIIGMRTGVRALQDMDKTPS